MIRYFCDWCDREIESSCIVIRTSEVQSLMTDENICKFCYGKLKDLKANCKACRSTKEQWETFDQATME